MNERDKRIIWVGRSVCDVCGKRSDRNVDFEPGVRLPPLRICRMCLKRALEVIKENG
jgi:hypothetical protein